MSENICIRNLKETFEALKSDQLLLIKNKYAGKNKKLREFLAESSTYLLDNIKEGFAKAENSTEFEDILKRHKNEVIKVQNSIRAVNDLLGEFDRQVGGLKNKDGVITEVQAREVLITMEQRHQKVQEMNEVKLGRVMEETLDNAQTGGRGGQSPDVGVTLNKGLENEIKGGHDLEEILKKDGISDPRKEMYLAAAGAGSGTKHPLIEAYTDVFKTLDSKGTAYLKGIDPTWTPRKEYVMPITYNATKMYRAGVEDYIDFMRGNINISKYTGGRPDKFDEMVKTQFNNKTSVTSDAAEVNPSSKLGSRLIEFNNKEAEYAFQVKFGDNMPNGLISSKISHLSQLAKAMEKRKMYGDDVQATKEILTSHIVDSGYKSPANMKVIKANKSAKKLGKPEMPIEGDELKSVGALIDSRLTSMNKKIFSDTNSYAAMYEKTTSGLSNIVSALLTTFSTVRNLIQDDTVMKGVVRAAYKDKQTMGVIWESLKSLGVIFRPNKVDYDMASDMLETVGIRTRLNINHMNQGKAMTHIGTNSKGWTGRLADNVSFWTMANRISHTSRADSFVQTTNILFNAISKKDYKDFPPALKMQFEINGLGEKEVKVLSTAPTIKNPMSKSDLMIDTKRINEISDAEIKTIKRPHETLSDARDRLRRDTEFIVSDMVDEMSARNSNRGDVNKRWEVENKGVGSILSLIFKFSNIGLSQWTNFSRMMHKAAGINPNKVGTTGGRLSLGGTIDWSLLPLAMKHPKAASKYMVGMVALAYIHVAGRDLVEGKTTRSLSVEMAYDGLISLGLAGDFSRLLGSMWYNGDVISTPLNRIGKPIKQIVEGSLELEGEKVVRGIDKLIPYSNLWYTKALKDYVLREYLDIEPPAWEKREMEEQGQEHLVD